MKKARSLENSRFLTPQSTGDERIELPPKVLETPIIPLDQSPIKVNCVSVSVTLDIYTIFIGGLSIGDFKKSSKLLLRKLLLISYYIKITSGLYDLQPEVTWFYFTLYLTFIYLPRLLLQFLLQALIFPTALLLSACYRSRKMQIHIADLSTGDPVERISLPHGFWQWLFLYPLTVVSWS